VLPSSPFRNPAIEIDVRKIQLDLTNDPMMVQKPAVVNEEEETVSNEVEISETAPEHEIKEIWSHNLQQEFVKICHLVQKYPFVAMDTEFPGTVAEPTGNFSQYQLVRCNVDNSKLIQLGITLFDGSGNLPKGVCTWQFNFKFNLEEDVYAEASIVLLKNSGIEFENHRSFGIEPSEFAELLLSSGLVLMDNVKWLTFHSASDFGYLLGLLTSQKLPDSEYEFLETLKIYFPNLYDVKYLMLSTNNLKGGLQAVANKLEVDRFGPQHQAGSDSLLTGKVFFKIYDEYFSHGLDDVNYSGQIYGFHSSIPTTSTGFHSNLPAASTSIGLHSNTPDASVSAGFHSNLPATSTSNEFQSSILATATSTGFHSNTPATSTFTANSKLDVSAEMEELNSSFLRG